MSADADRDARKAGAADCAHTRERPDLDSSLGPTACSGSPSTTRQPWLRYALAWTGFRWRSSSLRRRSKHLGPQALLSRLSTRLGLLMGPRDAPPRHQTLARDDLAEMFLKRVARFHTQAQQELELIRAQHRSLAEELIDTLTDILRLVESNPSDAELGRQVKSTIARHGEVGELLAGCDSIAAYSGDNHLALLWRF